MEDLRNNEESGEREVKWENIHSLEAEQTQFAEPGNAYNDKRHGADTDDDEEKEEKADEPRMNDWGDVDPQHGRMPSSNDPSAPGSAV